jgi:hypothetical protein
VARPTSATRADAISVIAHQHRPIAAPAGLVRRPAALTRRAIVHARTMGTTKRRTCRRARDRDHLPNCGLPREGNGRVHPPTRPPGASSGTIGRMYEPIPIYATPTRRSVRRRSATSPCRDDPVSLLPTRAPGGIIPTSRPRAPLYIFCSRSSCSSAFCWHLRRGRTSQSFGVSRAPHRTQGLEADLLGWKHSGAGHHAIGRSMPCAR